LPLALAVTVNDDTAIVAVTVGGGVVVGAVDLLPVHETVRRQTPTSANTDFMVWGHFFSWE